MALGSGFVSWQEGTRFGVVHVEAERGSFVSSTGRGRRRMANRLIRHCTRPREPSLTSGQSHDLRQSITHIKKTWTSEHWSLRHAINGATGANIFCTASEMAFFFFFLHLPGLQSNLFFFCTVFMLMSAIIKTCSTRNNKKTSTSWRQLLEVGWKQRGESGERAGCEESVNFSLSAPVFARFRVRGANGPNSHWLCVSVSAV